MRSFYEMETEAALLALIAYPEDEARACQESGCDTYHGFVLACDMACSQGWMEQTDSGRYVATAAGRQHGLQALQAEQRAHQAQQLTAREAAALHSDLFHTDAAWHDHPLSRKLAAIALGQDAQAQVLSHSEREAAVLASRLQGVGGSLRESAWRKLSV